MTKRLDLIKVLEIDDSAFSRQTITRMLETSPLVEVVGVARAGEDALRKTLELRRGRMIGSDRSADARKHAEFSVLTA